MVTKSTMANNTNGYVCLPDASSIFLTGATGFLGAYLLREILDTTRANVKCLVRASGAVAGMARLVSNLSSYRLDTDGLDSRVEIVCGDLAEPQFGLNDAHWNDLTNSIDVIIHGGARLDWLAPYAKLEKANVGGTEQIIDLARSGRSKSLHYVSSTGVYMSLDAPELGYLNRAQPLENYSRHVIGYLKSKWIAELKVQDCLSSGTTGAIHRPSFILGDLESGYIPDRDITRLFLQACFELGAVPDLDMFVDVMPADIVAKAIVNVASNADFNGRACNLSLPGVYAMRDIAAISDGMAKPLALLSFAAWRERLNEPPVSEAKRVMALFCWPIPGVQDGLLGWFSSIRHDPANGDISEALQGTGLSPPPLDLHLLESYCRSLVDPSTQRGDISRFEKPFLA